MNDDFVPSDVGLGSYPLGKSLTEPTNDELQAFQKRLGVVRGNPHFNPQTGKDQRFTIRVQTEDQHKKHRLSMGLALSSEFSTGFSVISDGVADIESKGDPEAQAGRLSLQSHGPALMRSDKSSLLLLATEPAFLGSKETANIVGNKGLTLLSGFGVEWPANEAIDKEFETAKELGKSFAEAREDVETWVKKISLVETNAVFGLSVVNTVSGLKTKMRKNALSVFALAREARSTAEADIEAAFGGDEGLVAVGNPGWSLLGMKSGELVAFDEINALSKSVSLVGGVSTSIYAGLEASMTAAKGASVTAGVEASVVAGKEVVIAARKKAGEVSILADEIKIGSDAAAGTQMPTSKIELLAMDKVEVASTAGAIRIDGQKKIDLNSPQEVVICSGTYKVTISKSGVSVADGSSAKIEMKSGSISASTEKSTFKLGKSGVVKLDGEKVFIC